MFTIGEFSRVTGLTVKTLRFYHEQGLLAPAQIDPNTGYRKYDAAQIETARVIAQLRKLEFPLAEIRELLKQRSDDEAEHEAKPHCGEDELDAQQSRKASGVERPFA